MLLLLLVTEEEMKLRSFWWCNAKAVYKHARLTCLVKPRVE